MGIKDNFSQAVKELWKKDGGENKKDEAKPQAGGSELDRYLRDSDGGSAAGSASGVEVTENGVPLETPYYRNAAPAESAKTDNNAQTSAAPDSARTQAPQGGQPQVANTQTRDNAAMGNNPPRAEKGGFGANPQDNSGQSYNQPYNQPYNQNVANIRRNSGGEGQPAPENSYNANGYNQNDYSPNNYNQGGYNQGGYAGSYGGNLGGPGVPGGYGGNPPVNGNIPNRSETDEITVISKNTMIDGNIRSLANMQIDGNIKGNVETTRNIDMSGKVVGDVVCNNAGMVSAAMQGNISLKGRMRMDRDTILIGDLSSQYADINGRIRGKLDIVGKAELKRDAVVFGDINASTIAVTDGAIIQGYVNTTFLSKEDSRNVFPDAISIDSKEVKS